MKRREMLIATGTAAATALAGCTGGNEGAPNAGAQNGSPPGSGQQRTITVSSTGDAESEPDLAVLNLGVEASADTAQAVRTDLSRRAEAVRSALLEYGLDEDDITTEHFNIHERIDRRKMEREGAKPDSPEAIEEYRYYQGTHAFRVEVSDIDAVGEVIDTAVGAGANQVDRVTFTLSEERRASLRQEALKEAIENARSEAETIASEVGASIVEATVVDASDARLSPVYREVAYAGDAGGMPTEAPTPTTRVEPGDVTVTANVRIRYTME